LNRVEFYDRQWEVSSEFDIIEQVTIFHILISDASNLLRTANKFRE
jgi:hypothetical protein